ncbi:expressed protein [Echinococcus multilocularis]|uniref:Expressed protein n=1 Tax=Echinococcus multilocularis TaxID=6211 RepID=A0A068Y3T6_ECHMU|nr:expressed protein [Echinococcus multilocularis]
MQDVVAPSETSEHSVSVLDSEAELPFHHLIVLDAVKRHFGFCDVCCVRLVDQQDLIAVAKTDETTLDIFIPCNAPAAPSSISWTTEHLVERLLPPPSSHRPLTAAISRHLCRQIDEGSIRFHLVFLDADCGPLFVTAQRGFMDAVEFDTVMSKRRQTRISPRPSSSSAVRSGQPFPTVGIFDCPDPGVCTDRDDPYIGPLQDILFHKFGTFSDVQSFLLLNEISVFSFALLDLSSNGFENSDLEFQRTIASWPQALFLGTSGQLGSCATYVLLVKVADNVRRSAHLLSLNRYGTAFKCLSEFYFAESFLDVERFLWGITSLVFQQHSLPRNYQLTLTTALFVPGCKSFAEQIYLLIFLAFAYPLFGATPSFISHLQIRDVSANLFWHEIVRLVLQRNSRLSFLSFRTKNAVLCEIELLIHQFGLSRVWQGYDCHPLDVFLRDISDLNDPLVVGILRTCLLPYIHGDADIIKLLPVYRLIDIMLSTSVCGAFADYHPRVVVAMLEDCNLVKNSLRFCGHLHTLLGESQLEGWVSRVFSLYQHCSEQVGIFDTSLRRKWRFDWPDVSYLLERLERQSLDIGDSGGAGSSRVPRLTQVACRVFRYTMRQYLDGLPPPRPSFTAQIEALKGIPPAVKRIVLFKAEDS